MDRAKVAVQEFLHKADHSDTTVHEKVAPAVVHETVKEARKIEEQPVIDREVHVDHYHTSVQPVYDREILPEKHVHQSLPVEHREVRHGDDRGVSTRLQQEAARFHDKTVHAGVQETHVKVAPVVGEHKHHHVHETIQPVLQKETIQTHVVHTTVPIHEVHHEGTKVHSTTALPAVSMTEFKAQGGALSGREERYDGFEGEPKNIASTLGSGSHIGGVGPSVGHYSGTGLTGHHHNATTTTGTGLTGHHHDTTTTGTGLTGHNHGNTTTTGTHKPSLLDKLNPLKDTDHDGKKGIME